MMNFLSILASLAFAGTTPVTPTPAGNFAILKSSGQVVIQSTATTRDHRVFEVRTSTGYRIFSIQQDGSITISSGIAGGYWTFTSITVATATIDTLAIRGPATFHTQGGSTTLWGLGTVKLGFKTTNTDAAARNWVFLSEQDVNGDFGLYRSASQGADAATDRTKVFLVTPGGGISFWNGPVTNTSSGTWRTESGDTQLQFLSVNTARTMLQFGDPSSTSRGSIFYHGGSHATAPDAMTFSIGGSERLRLAPAAQGGAGISGIPLTVIASTISVRGVSDGTGVLIEAATTGRPNLEFFNVSSGKLGDIIGLNGTDLAVRPTRGLSLGGGTGGVTVAGTTFTVTASMPTGSASFDVGTNIGVNSTGNNYVEFRGDTGETAYQGLLFSDDVSGRGYILYKHGDDTLGFKVAGAVGMTLTATGLGIGTENPGTKLHMSSGTATIDGNTATKVTLNHNAASAVGSTLSLQKSRSGAIVQSGDTIGVLDFAGATGTTYDSAGQIAVLSGGTPGASGDMPGAVVIYTTGDGSATPTERLRIDAKGHIETAGGTTPTLSSCGTSPSIVGNDNIMRITTGTGASGCTVTFANAWQNAPICMCDDESAVVTCRVTSNSTTSVAIAGTGASETVDVMCLGYR